MTLRPLRCVVLLAVFLVASGWARAAPEAELWPRWQAHDPTSRAMVEHSAWQAFLDRYVIRGPGGVNRVHYAGVTAADRAALDAYLDALGAVAVTGLNRGEQRAYWINLYNALTVRVVLDHYPVDSIRDIDISPGLFADGPWGAKLVSVEGVRLSLDDIEHRILRPIWRDPRLHYALNCASLGCPDLMREAFTSFNAERLLDAAARRYVNHPRGVRIDDADQVIASSIYDWFREDFGGSDSAVLGHLLKYAELRLAVQLATRSEIADYGYDWALNDAAPAVGAARGGAAD